MLLRAVLKVKSVRTFFLLFSQLISAIILGQSYLTHAEASQVQLIWDSTYSPDLMGYRLYFGNSSRLYTECIDVGNATSYRLEDLNPNQTYFFSVTAYDIHGNESPFSEELTYQNSALQATEIRLEAEDGFINAPMEIAWDAGAIYGEYVWVPLGAAAAIGWAEYHFTIPVSGNYLILARVKSASPLRNTLSVTIDYGREILWDTEASDQGLWVWDALSDRFGANPVVVNLQEGAHTLTVYSEEAGVKLDRIFIIPSDIE